MDRELRIHSGTNQLVRFIWLWFGWLQVVPGATGWPVLTESLRFALTLVKRS